MEEYNLSNISVKFKFIREKNNISQNKLSKKIGIHRSTVSDIERGLKIPSTTTIIKFCAYFNISADYLLSINESNPKVDDVYDLYLNQEEYIHLENFNDKEKKVFKNFVKGLEEARNIK